MPMPEQPAQDAMEAALTAAIEQAREEGQPVDEIAQAAAQGAEITTEIIDTEDGRHEIMPLPPKSGSAASADVSSSGSSRHWKPCPTR